MPKVEIEIMRTVTVTREESVVVELDVPQSVLDGEHEGVEIGVVDWVDGIMAKCEVTASLTDEDRAVRKALDTAAWDVTDNHEYVEYNDAYELN